MLDADSEEFYLITVDQVHVYINCCDYSSLHDHLFFWRAGFAVIRLEAVVSKDPAHFAGWRQLVEVLLAFALRSPKLCAQKTLSYFFLPAAAAILSQSLS